MTNMRKNGWTTEECKSLPSVPCPVRIKLVHPMAQVPSFQTPGSAGMDLCSVQNIIIHPGNRVMVDTGIKIQLPIGYEAQIRPRSGLAIKHGITCINSPGTVDSDFTGNLMVLLINHSREMYQINVGDRIAQMVIAKYERPTFTVLTESEELEDTERGEGGFGSTGAA